MEYKHMKETLIILHNQKENRIEKRKDGKLVLEVINAGLTFGNCICTIVVFTVGILLLGLIKAYQENHLVL